MRCFGYSNDCDLMYFEISDLQAKNSNSGSTKLVADSKDFMTHCNPTQFIALTKIGFR